MPATTRRQFSIAVGTTLTVALLSACSSGSAAVVGSGSGGGGTDDKHVSIALSPGFDEDIAATYLWKQVLEDKGYTVDVRELEVAQAYAGVASGQVDLYLDAWLPTAHQPYWDKYSDDLEKMSGWYDPAALNLAVPEYMTDVNTIADLQAQSAEFGGQIVGIEPGTGLMRLAEEAVIPGYGLDDYTLVESSTPAMLAALDKAVAAEQPIVVTLWTPHWAFTKYPIKPLQDPDGAFGEPDTATVVANAEFSENQAEVAGWMNEFSMTEDQLGSIELLIQEMGPGNEQAAAAEWLKSNQEVADAWTS